MLRRIAYPAEQLLISTIVEQKVWVISSDCGKLFKHSSLVQIEIYKIAHNIHTTLLLKTCMTSYLIQYS